jgi:hypothetical protein
MQTVGDRADRRMRTGAESLAESKVKSRPREARRLLAERLPGSEYRERPRQ